MKAIFTIALAAIWLVQAYAIEMFAFEPVPGYGFTLSLGTTKPEAKMRVLKKYRDQEGDSFVLIYTQGAFPVIGGRSSSNMPQILPQDNLYTVARISPEGKPIWFYHINNHGNKDFSLLNFKVSPQGNIVLILNFKGDLEVQGSLRKFRSIKEDLLYVFVKKSNGGLLKTLHFTGRENEFHGGLTFGTGGEILIDVQSTSNKVSFDHGYYIFNTKSDKPVPKDLLIRLKDTFYPKWSRSIEPQGLTDVTFHDKDKVLISFDHTFEYVGFFRKGRTIKSYQKSKKDAPRGIAISLDAEGKKEWDLQLRHPEYGSGFSTTKAFPDGSVGLLGSMGKDVELYGQRTYSHTGKEKSRQLFLKVGTNGLLEKDALLIGKNSGVGIVKSYSDGTIFMMNSGADEELSYNNYGGSVTSIKPSSKKNCPTLFIVDKTHSPAYELNSSSCSDNSSLKSAHMRLASGHIEILRETAAPALQLLKIKYGENKLDDETIQGLAYQPNFINQNVPKGTAIDYNMSYAVPPKPIGVMVYFISHPKEHLDALKDPLFQASLNAAYFRNYVPVTVWSADKDIKGVNIEELFEDLIEKKILSLSWPWFFQAYGDRASQISALYKDPRYGKFGMLSPKNLVLWDYPSPPVENSNNDEVIKLKVTESLPTLFVSSWKDTKEVKKVEKFYTTFADQRKKSSHIITAPQIIGRGTFAAIPGIGIAKSEEIFEELKKQEDCLHPQGFFAKDPQDPRFKNPCFKGLESLKLVAPAARDRLFHFMKEIYNPSDFIPHYDKEIYNFLEGTYKPKKKGKLAPGP